MEGSGSLKFPSAAEAPMRTHRDLAGHLQVMNGLACSGPEAFVAELLSDGVRTAVTWYSRYRWSSVSDTRSPGDALRNARSKGFLAVHQ